MKKTTERILVLAAFLAFCGSATFAQSPKVAAPTPPARSNPKVISIFSDAYSDVSGTIFNPFWSQSTVVTTTNIAGNPTMKYTNFNWQGIELGQDINALPMTHLHIDVWTSNETSMQITPISHSTSEVLVSLSPLKLNEWNSFDIPLTKFTGKGLSLSDIFQFKLAGAGTHTVFIDNLYFYNNMEGEDTEGPTAFTVSSGLITFNSIELLLNATDASGAVDYAITNGTTTIPLSCASGVQKSYTFMLLKAATAYNFSITAKDNSGNLASNSPVLLSETTTSAPKPAPTPPVRPANKVISVFSDAYTNSCGATNFGPYWNQVTVASVTDFQGNPTLKYENLNYQGTELGNDVNALPMTHLHIDVWTPNETVLKIAPVSRSKTNVTVELTPLKLSTWNSFDISLADVKSKWLSVSDIFQFMIEGAGGHTVYIDNLYFYNNSTTADTEAPTAFTATKGLVTFNSIELLLKATDNSGAVTFDIKYGTKSLTVNGISGQTKSITIDLLNGATAYNFSVSVKDPSKNIATNSPVVFAVTTLEAIPAPIPTENAADVISIFSDTYPNISGSNYNPAWSQATIQTATDIKGNAVLCYANLNYQGTEFGSHVNAKDMTHFHVDVWTADESSLQITVISPGKEKLVALTPLNKKVWNSFDISLKLFTDVNLADLFQFKFVGSGGKMVYLDNLYFYKAIPSSISDTEAQSTIQIYPNPVTAKFKLVSASAMSEIQISTISGQLVKKVLVNALETTLDLSQMPSGTYLILVKHCNGKVTFQKVLKF